MHLRVRDRTRKVAKAKPVSAFVLVPLLPTDPSLSFGSLAIALAKQQQAQAGKNKEALAKEKERDAREKEKAAEAKRKAEMNELFKPVQVQQKVRTSTQPTQLGRLPVLM